MNQDQWIESYVEFFFFFFFFSRGLNEEHLCEIILNLDLLIKNFIPPLPSLA